MATNESLPTPHGCATFTPPPLDGSVTLPEVFDFNGDKNPDHILFRYFENGQIRDIPWSVARQAIHKAARKVIGLIGSTAKESRPVVGILALSDSMSYLITIAGIMRAGYIPFPISPRNSPAAVANLIKSTARNNLLVSSDPAMQNLLKAARGMLPEDLNLSVFDMLKFKELFNDEPVDLLPPLKNISIDDTAVILHSSGSTAFPKPILLTMRIMLEAGLAPYYGEVNMSKEILSSHAVPMFHLMGVVQIPWTSIAGLTIAVFPPHDPPILPTPDRVFNDAVSTRSTVLFSAPLFLEQWFRNPQYLAELKKFNIVIYAGGPLDPYVGDRLVEEGVSIVSLYGSTESGPLTMCLPKGATPEGWSYWRASRHVDPVLIPYEEKENVYRLLVKKSPIHNPAIINAEVDGVPCLDTNDLVTLHPSNPKLYKIHGRFDDQIMHSTGEKTNPVPLESILVKNPHISSAIMFGRTRFNTGVIITPTPPTTVEPSNSEQLAEFRNLIWPAVEEANAYAPAHSRIFKEMILAADPSKPFEFTPKGTPRRQAVLDAYAAEIDAAYEAFKQSSQEHIDGPKSWTIEECKELVRSVISTVIKVGVEDDEDIFQKGCDSLQATWIRNTLLRTLPSTVDSRAISQNFVYGYPTISQLSHFLSDLCGNKPAKTASEHTDSKAEEMIKLVDRYSADFPQHVGSVPDADHEVVLLTGATGSFGSQLLAKLLNTPSVTKVYVLNRRSSQPAQVRQEASFSKSGLDAGVLKSQKLVILEADLATKGCGLDKGTYATLQQELTCIIHNAWRVDFNVAVSSMEPLLQGTRHLLDLALTTKLQTPPRFIFISSISVFARWTSGPAPESRISDPRVSVHSGYSESKWCAEELLHRAASATPLRPLIVRVGQLSGDSKGYWNTADWLPALVKSSQTLKCVPNIEGPLSWIAIDEAASAVLEMRRNNHQYVNLVHPNPSPAQTVFAAIARQLELALVPPSKWLEHLASADGQISVSRVPALHLLDFFQEHLVDGPPPGIAEAMGFPPLSIERACESSPCLQGLKNSSVGPNDVYNWLKFWKQAGFLI